jgi:hypothetical protein
MELSFGIEIEGVAVSPISCGPRFPENTHDQLGLLAHALNDAGLDASVYLPSGTRAIG